jgi:PhzF family phenazine biosynthesis protein
MPMDSSRIFNTDLPMYIVDAFTVDGKAGTGNPAAVCLMGSAQRNDAWHQTVAREMNLSETAFVSVPPGGNFAEGPWRLRWFTPTMEVDLCGHATLAAAHVLTLDDPPGLAPPVVFSTRSGTLEAWPKSDGMLELVFPDETPWEEPDPEFARVLAEVLGAKPIWAGRNRMDLFALFPFEQQVRALRPEFQRWNALPSHRGVIVTAAMPADGYDFVSRFFAPNAGIQEDPVTGSAHCALGPFWAARLKKEKLFGYQASARGGAVRVTMDIASVRLGGQAVLVLEGSFNAAAFDC